MSELVPHSASELTAQMDFARALASGDILPAAYRDKPANVLVAIGLGQSMGLSPAESLYRIDVIGGKPTASAELIAANVRKAGHKLRVRVDEAAQSVTASIVRADDPEFEHTVTRDLNWAKQMGLASKDNYKKQPTTMLQWRAISAVARLACPEALYGVAYTADEVHDMPSVEAPPRRQATVEDFTAEPAPVDVTHAEVVEEPAQNTDDYKATKPQLAKLYTMMGKAGLGNSRDLALKTISGVIGRDIESSEDLTRAEIQVVFTELEALEAGVSQ